MSISPPEELCTRFGARMPEDLARAMGFTVQRQETSPMLPGVRVMSELRSDGVIVLYLDELRLEALRKRESLTRLEQWHIAHELYHHLAEVAGISPWRIREGDADHWADELITLAMKSHPRW
ncbi:MAG TPA: hypothetical protein VGM23_01675 [Armatimonadota bacterium]|jgi:hypothetical protein